MKKLIPLLCLVCLNAFSAEEQLPLVDEVEWQPLAAQTQRLIDATQFLGSVISEKDRNRLQKLIAQDAEKDSVENIQNVLDRYCLFSVHINPEMRVKVAQGPAKPELLEQGWRVFLVKVQNESGTTAELKATSLNALAL